MNDSTVSNQRQTSHESVATVAVEDVAEKTAEGNTPDNKPADEWHPSREFKLLMTLVLFVTLLVACESTAVSPAIPTIAQELHGTVTQSIWIGSSFLLTSAVFQPILASISHHFGRMPVFFVSLLLFNVGSIMCGVAKQMNVVIAGRSVQGLGGGGILVLTEILMADLIPLRVRGNYYSMIGSMWSIGTVIGPILGGGFTSSSASWRWVFYINIPFGGIAMVLIPFLIRLEIEKLPVIEKLKSFDYVGTAIFLPSSTAFILGITFGGVMFPWKSYHVLVPLILGVVGMIAAGVYEKFTVTKFPIVNVAILKQRSAVVGYILICFHGMIMWCVIYYLPLYYQAVKLYSPVISGVAALPETLLVAPSAVVSALIITKLGHYMWASYMSWALMTIGLGILTLLKVETSVGQWIGYNIIFAIGAGQIYSVGNFLVSTCNPASLSAEANAFVAFVRVLGNAVGVAVGGAIFSNELIKHAKQYPDAIAILGESSSASYAAVEIIRSLPAGSTKSHLQLAFSDSVRYIWYVCIALSGVGFFLNFLAKNYSMDVVIESRQAVVEKPRDKESTAGTRPEEVEQLEDV